MCTFWLEVRSRILILRFAEILPGYQSGPMTTLDFTWGSNATWLNSLAGLFRRPARLQIAALCYRTTGTEPEILLVTSRGQGRWILPKGWPEPNKAAFETAVIEAYEEAGISGEVDRKPYASFASKKGLENGLSIRTKVLVFRICFKSQFDDFPEKGQRKVAWMPVSEAIEHADEAGLRKVLRRFKAEVARGRLAAAPKS